MNAAIENERHRAMIHDLIVAILDGRETREDEPVPRSINSTTFRKALNAAIAAYASPTKSEVARDE